MKTGTLRKTDTAARAARSLVVSYCGAKETWLSLMEILEQRTGFWIANTNPVQLNTTSVQPFDQTPGEKLWECNHRSRSRGYIQQR